MKKIIIALILVLFLLSGCKKVSELTKSTKDIVNETNQTINQTIAENITTSNYEANKTNIFLFQSGYDCIFIIGKDNSTTLIGCGGIDFLKNMKKIIDLGFSKIDTFVFYETRENMDLLTKKFKPTTITQKNYLVLENIVIMLNCNGDCEKEITVENQKFLYLTNNGLCPTNSLDFLVQINPEIIVSNDGLCEETKNFVVTLGIKNYFKNKEDIHIVLDENSIEVI